MVAVFNDGSHTVRTMRLTSQRLKELKARARELDKRFKNSRGEGDSRNNHLASKEVWSQIRAEEERLRQESAADRLHAEKESEAEYMSPDE
jgi:hypothetical protein